MKRPHPSLIYNCGHLESGSRRGLNRTIVEPYRCPICLKDIIPMGNDAANVQRRSWRKMAK